jgi:hypothetical protein
VEPHGPLVFGYAVVSSSGGTLPTFTVDGKAADLSALIAPWYVAQAVGDINGNGVFTKIYALSQTNQLMVDNEGE